MNVHLEKQRTTEGGGAEASSRDRKQEASVVKAAVGQLCVSSVGQGGT